MSNLYRGSSRFDRVDQDEVPESKHTIFIRGLPGYVKTDEVKDFFEDHIGPCSFDFIKISPDQLKLFVAVRFETREAAKECMNRYRDSEVLGHPVELSWFKDIRRYVSYQQSQGARPNSSSRNRYGNNRKYSNSGQSNYDRSRNDYRVDDVDSKKRVSSRERNSYSKSSSSACHSSRNSSREPSPLVGSHSRGIRKHSHDDSDVSVSQNCDRSASTPATQQIPLKQAFEGPGKSVAPALPPSPPQEVSVALNEKQPAFQERKRNSSSPSPDKKFYKTKKEKKKRRRRSPSYSTSNSEANRSSEDLSEGELRKKILKKRQKALRGEMEKETKQDQEVVSKLDSNTASNTVREQMSNLQNTTLKFGLESNDDIPKKVLKEDLTTLQQKSVAPLKIPADTMKLESLRSQPSLSIKRSVLDELDDTIQPSSLRLSSFTRQMTAESERERKLACLPPELFAKFVAKKKQFDAALKADCETYTFVVKMLIQKDPELEERLQLALSEAKKDIEDRFSERIDEYLDQLITLFSSV